MARTVAQGSLSTVPGVVRTPPEAPTLRRFGGATQWEPHVVGHDTPPDVAQREMRRDLALGAFAKLTENARTVAEASSAVSSAESSARKYLSRVLSYCTGTTPAAPDGIDARPLLGQHTGWAAIDTDAMLSVWAEPEKAEDASGKQHAQGIARSANARIRDLQNRVADVDSFVRATYRTFPQPFTAEPLRGWFRWTLRMTINQLADRMSEYLSDIAEFHEPPLPSAESPAETRAAILRHVPDLTDALGPWSSLQQTLRDATADRSTKPGVLGPSLDGTVTRIARSVENADTTLRTLTRSGRM
ncbi:hypothetical protein [Myceligenerans xiligouense]|uniref:Uncharacterized protein n=1 Tax=Myceligenerans xiligouense TaxID=253184 RepID=A0A3N4ZLU4_9MICO|nr:hypothetical protein [Myceligenerans xiligouense]RPF21885.1 hypothetical protein EDD34_2521 [Myceligenerans xiligouense]